MVHGYKDGEEQRHEREAIRDAENWDLVRFHGMDCFSKMKLLVSWVRLQSLKIYFPRIWGTYSLAKSIALSPGLLCAGLFSVCLPAHDELGQAGGGRMYDRVFTPVILHRN